MVGLPSSPLTKEKGSLSATPFAAFHHDMDDVINLPCIHVAFPNRFSFSVFVIGALHSFSRVSPPLIGLQAHVAYYSSKFWLGSFAQI